VLAGRASRSFGQLFQGNELTVLTMLPEEARLLDELQRLEERQMGLDRDIAGTWHRQRHSKEPEDAERAKVEEQFLALEMDRLMTRIRAVEGQLLQVRKLSRR
jgi:uncharacterized membrane protein YccC